MREWAEYVAKIVRLEIHAKVLPENVKEADYLEDTGIDESIYVRLTARFR
jgi:hypothetical protein